MATPYFQSRPKGAKAGSMILAHIAEPGFAQIGALVGEVAEHPDHHCDHKDNLTGLGDKVFAAIPGIAQQRLP